jgi:hypothetical protein
VALEGKTILVPAIWSLEIVNAVLVGERKKRLRLPEILRFTTLLESLPVLQDIQPVGDHVSNVLPLAREYRPVGLRCLLSGTLDPQQRTAGHASQLTSGASDNTG